MTFHVPEELLQPPAPKTKARMQINDTASLLDGLVDVVRTDPKAFTQEDVSKIGFFLASKIERATRDMQDALRGYPFQASRFDFDTAPLPSDGVVMRPVTAASGQNAARGIAHQPRAETPPAAVPEAPAPARPAGRIPASRLEGRLVGTGLPVAASPIPAAPPPSPQTDISAEGEVDFLEE